VPVDTSNSSTEAEFKKIFTQCEKWANLSYRYVLSQTVHWASRGLSTLSFCIIICVRQISAHAFWEKQAGLMIPLMYTTFCNVA